MDTHILETKLLCICGGYDGGTGGDHGWGGGGGLSLTKGVPFPYGHHSGGQAGRERVPQREGRGPQRGERGGEVACKLGEGVARQPPGPRHAFYIWLPMPSPPAASSRRIVVRPSPYPPPTPQPVATAVAVVVHFFFLHLSLLSLSLLAALHKKRAGRSVGVCERAWFLPIYYHK